MLLDSAVKVLPQQSVKAYVDSQLTVQDLDFSDGTDSALSIDLEVLLTSQVEQVLQQQVQVIGVTVNIGQSVGTTDNVTFNNVDIDGTLTSDDITSTNILYSRKLNSFR